MVVGLMKKLVLLCATLALVGCGDDDTRTVMLMDSGPGTDSGGGGVDTGPSGTDSGPMGTDSGGGSRDCEMALESLPSVILPRCSADTATCINGCADIDCQNMCLDADTTPPETMSGQMIDCNICFNYQVNVCIDMNCPTEFAAFRCCLEDNACTDASCPACSSQLSAVQSCAGGLPAGACTDQITACFPSM